MDEWPLIPCFSIKLLYVLESQRYQSSAPYQWYSSKKAHADSLTFFYTHARVLYLVYGLFAIMCTFILNCVKEMRIFIIVARKPFSVSSSIQMTGHLHVLLSSSAFVCVFWWIRGVVYLRLAVRREWWSIGIVWCFILIMETWAGRSHPESWSFQTSTHKNAHLTSEWWTFINMIYFVTHTCYPACLNVCFSCAHRTLVTRVVLLRLIKQVILCILPGLINTDTWKACCLVRLETATHLLSDIIMNFIKLRE